MNKVVLSLIFSAFMAAPVFAQTPAPAPVPAEGTEAPVKMRHVHHERHPEIHKAMRKLRGAKADLEKAAHDYAGHKAKAIAAINEAMEELHEALAADRE